MGDTLATARLTRLDGSGPGDHYVVSSATIGDGTYGTREVDLYKLTATAGSSITAITSRPWTVIAMDTVLRLFNSRGTQLAVNDNFTGLYSRLDYTLAA